MTSKYRIAKHPKTSKFHVVGNCGNGYWMPISKGFNNHTQADDWMKIQRRVVDPAAKRCAAGV